MSVPYGQRVNADRRGTHDFLPLLPLPADYVPGLPNMFRGWNLYNAVLTDIVWKLLRIT